MRAADGAGQERDVHRRDADRGGSQHLELCLVGKGERAGGGGGEGYRWSCDALLLESWKKNFEFEF